MIRAGTFTDIPALAKLVRASHERSKYAGRTGINDKALETMLMGLVAGQNQSGPQSTHVSVYEKAGEVTGFVAGSLSRVYSIGEKLVASDHFLINEKASLTTTMRLLDAYIDWARNNPKVIEIGLSWSDALPGAEAVAQLYKRKGFHKVGEQFEIRLDLAAEKEAA